MVGGITSLALAAIDIALWDLRCLRAGEPLWRVAGGFRSRLPLYDTENGWLHLSTDELVSGAKAASDAGWRGVKLKVGNVNPELDAEKVTRVREVLGEDIWLAVDAKDDWMPCIAEMPRLGLALTKQAVNHVEDLRGKRTAMDAVFHMHHFAHAQNDLVSGDSLAGLDGKAMARVNKNNEGET